MKKKLLLGVVSAALMAVMMPSMVHAYGAAHVGYTHVGPNGVYHAGETVARGPGGAYAGGRTTAAGYGGAEYRGGYGAAEHRGGYGYAPSYAAGRIMRTCGSLPGGSRDSA